MHVKVYSYTDEDYETRQQLFIDDKCVQYVGPLCECPEDAIIGRDLVSCEDIAEYMSRAACAVQNGETFTMERIDVDRDAWDAL
jgi:hypothetical protein